jgi:hypothetical protein
MDTKKSNAGIPLLTTKKLIDNCKPFFYNSRANKDNQGGKR